MNTRSIAFLLTAVGICIGTLQLKAHEPTPAEPITQNAAEPVTGDRCEADQADLEAWMICEQWMLDEEAIAVDEVIEPILADETVAQEVAETREEEDESRANESADIVCAEGDVNPQEISVVDTTVADESPESEAVLSDTTEQAGPRDDEQICQQAATEDLECTAKEAFTDHELTGRSIWIEVFEACSDEGEIVADESSLDEHTVEEAADTIATAEAESPEVVEPLVEVATSAEPEIDSVTENVVHEIEAGMFRTFELGGCKLMVQSEHQLDDFELLQMLREAADRLEAQLD